MGLFQTWRRAMRLRKLRAVIFDSGDVRRARAIVDDLDRDGMLTAPPADLLRDACGERDRAACVELLLQRGWLPGLAVADALGRTPLHRAVECGATETVRVLLHAGADPNVRDGDGVTPLNLCKSFHGLDDVSQLLLAAGGNPKLVDKHGKNYLM